MATKKLQPIEMTVVWWMIFCGLYTLGHNANKMCATLNMSTTSDPISNFKDCKHRLWMEYFVKLIVLGDYIAIWISKLKTHRKSKSQKYFWLFASQFLLEALEPRKVESSSQQCALAASTFIIQHHGCQSYVLIGLKNIICKKKRKEKKERETIRRADKLSAR